MQLKYGNWFWASDSNEIRTTRELVKNAGGQTLALKHVWQVGGRVFGEGQAAVSAQCLLLEAALRIPFGNLVLLHDDGSQSAALLVNAGSSTGVQVTSGPNWDMQHGSEFALERHFTATFEAEYPLPQAANYLLDFHESISYSGGGPMRVARRALNRPPLIQQPYRFTEFRAVQSGFSVGYLKAPRAAAPNWPNALEVGPDTVIHSPRRMGKMYQEFRVEWTYRFVSATPLVGMPHRWVG